MYRLTVSGHSHLQFIWFAIHFLFVRLTLTLLHCVEKTLLYNVMVILLFFHENYLFLTNSKWYVIAVRCQITSMKMFAKPFGSTEIFFVMSNVN